MIRHFADAATEDLFNGIDSRLLFGAYGIVLICATLLAAAVWLLPTLDRN